MKKLLYIFWFLTITLQGSTYYVSTTGDDGDAGTIVAPWATWGKAFTSTSVNAGDTVFIRGGVYNITVTNGDGYSVTRAGTSNNWIVYTNYPGETPILDCYNADPVSTNYNSGIIASTVGGANYIKFRGLIVRNLRQIYTDHMVFCGAFGCENGEFIYENCTAYNIEGKGFDSYFYVVYPSVNGHHYFINCDAYECYNPTNPTGYLPGNAGVGFNSQNWYGTEGRAYVINCRAWRCGDQGFSWNGEHYCEVDSCWSFDNGVLQGDGHGFKLGWHDNPYNGTDRLNVVVKKSIAAYNRASGMTTNDYGEGISTGMNIYNNTVYHNGYQGEGYDYTYGFYIYNTLDTDGNELLRIFRNNISYDNEGGEVAVGSGASYTHSNNSWDGGATITDADFKALPATMSAGISLLSSSRQADGSLPDLGNYFQLAEGSDAINAGVDVGLAYDGDAPDLGFAEYAEVGASTATDILAFTFTEQTGSAIITPHTVSIEVEWDAVITSLTPTITVSGGATIAPLSGVSQDFTSPVTYTVTAEDTVTEQEWTVTVTQEAEPSTGIKLLKHGSKLLKNGTKFLK